MTIDTKDLQLDEVTTARHSAEYEARGAGRLAGEIDALRARAEKAEAERDAARAEIARLEAFCASEGIRAALAGTADAEGDGK